MRREIISNYKYAFVVVCGTKTVPSPDDCPLREQKIILNKSVRKSARITRDNYCQTELTLPPILPKSVEDALRPYFTFTQDQQQATVQYCSSPAVGSKTITDVSMGTYAPIICIMLHAYHVL